MATGKVLAFDLERFDEYGRGRPAGSVEVGVRVPNVFEAAQEDGRLG